MCGCRGHEVCRYHFDQIERAYLEERELEQNEQAPDPPGWLRPPGLDERNPI